jgi:hypothetical protein
MNYPPDFVRRTDRSGLEAANPEEALILAAFIAVGLAVELRDLTEETE